MARKTTRLIGVTTYLPPDEYRELQINAARARLSCSGYLRRVARGQPIQSLEFEQERMQMRQLKGMLGSLGGLLKQALAAGANKSLIYSLLRQLDQRQRELQLIIEKMRRD